MAAAAIAEYAGLSIESSVWWLETANETLANSGIEFIPGIDAIGELGAQLAANMKQQQVEQITSDLKTAAEEIAQGYGTMVGWLVHETLMWRGERS